MIFAHFSRACGILSLNCRPSGHEFFTGRRAQSR